MQCKTVRVAAWAPESQGPFVEINETDFDPALHKAYVEPEAPLAQQEPAKADPQPAVAKKKGA